MASCSTCGQFRQRGQDVGLGFPSSVFNSLVRSWSIVRGRDGVEQGEDLSFFFTLKATGAPVSDPAW